MNKIICSSSSIISVKEQQAQDLVKNGSFDEAIAAYQNLESNSSRILVIIGTLYGDKKGDYELAVHYFEQALKLQEKVYRFVCWLFEKLIKDIFIIHCRMEMIRVILIMNLVMPIKIFVNMTKH